jgi:hypothetical protein
MVEIVEESMNRRLPLESIHSAAKFVLYSEKEGVVSEHEQAPDAMRKLSILVGGDPDSPTGIYERRDEWVRIL